MDIMLATIMDLIAQSRRISQCLDGLSMESEPFNVIAGKPHIMCYIFVIIVATYYSGSNAVRYRFDLAVSLFNYKSWLTTWEFD